VWARFGGSCACRFDVVAFEAGRLVWLRDAFRADEA
jgi:putative endonuclease